MHAMFRLLLITPPRHIHLSLAPWSKTHRSKTMLNLGSFASQASIVWEFLPLFIQSTLRLSLCLFSVPLGVDDYGYPLYLLHKTHMNSRVPRLCGTVQLWSEFEGRNCFYQEEVALLQVFLRKVDMTDASLTGLGPSATVITRFSTVGPKCARANNVPAGAKSLRPQAQRPKSNCVSTVGPVALP